MLLNNNISTSEKKNDLNVLANIEDPSTFMINSMEQSFLRS